MLGLGAPELISLGKANGCSGGLAGPEESYRLGMQTLEKGLPRRKGELLEVLGKNTGLHLLDVTVCVELGVRKLSKGTKNATARR